MEMSISANDSSEPRAILPGPWRNSGRDRSDAACRLVAAGRLANGSGCCDQQRSKHSSCARGTAYSLPTASHPVGSTIARASFRSRRLRRWWSRAAIAAKWRLLASHTSVL
jgi:hypothetical protein